MLKVVKFEADAPQTSYLTATSTLINHPEQLTRVSVQGNKIEAQGTCQLTVHPGFRAIPSTKNQSHTFNKQK